MTEPDSPPEELPSYCKSLFSGVIAAHLAFPFPELPTLEAEALVDYLDDLERFLDAKVDGAAFDREAAIPEGVLDGLAERGVFGLYVSEEYGGMGFSQGQTAQVVQRIAARDPGLAVLLGSHLSIGIKGIDMYGTEAQKRWLRSRSQSPTTDRMPPTSSPAPCGRRTAPAGSWTATRSGSATRTEQESLPCSRRHPWRRTAKRSIA
jgi:hypothetical protein